MVQTYAERIWWSFAEPINTITNLAFLTAAVLAWNLAHRHRVRSASVRVLVVLAVAVGVGSAVWHIFASTWALPMDLVPILVFQLWFLWNYLRSCVRSSVAMANVAVVAYGSISVATLQVPPIFNGSIHYAPTLIALLTIGVYHCVSDQPGRWMLIIGAILFSLALIFRSIDLASAPYIPCGTHCLWHLLNGALLYNAMAAIILKQAQQLGGLTPKPAGDELSTGADGHQGPEAFLAQK